MKATRRTGNLKTHYKKAKPITEAEAHYIIAHATTSDEWVVLQHFDKWLDVRGLTKAEVADTVEELDRLRAAELASGIANPH